MKKQLSENTKYIIILRWAVGIGATFAWGLSIWWSSDGFNISVNEYQWLGYALGMFVTVSELLFNKGSKNPTIWLVGIFAYLYGYGTNIAGIKQYLGLDMSPQLWKTDFSLAAVNSMIVYGLGAIVEIAPESFILWALYPDQTSFGDFISSLFAGSGLNKTTNERTNRISANERTNERNINERTSERTNEQKPFPYRVNWREFVQKYDGTNVLLIVMFAKEYWNKHGKDCPNKIVVERTKAKSSQVSEVLKAMKNGEYA